MDTKSVRALLLWASDFNEASEQICTGFKQQLCEIYDPFFEPLDFSCFECIRHYSF
jgi:hypothetical protein